MKTLLKGISLWIFFIGFWNCKVKTEDDHTFHEEFSSVGLNSDSVFISKWQFNSSIRAIQALDDHTLWFAGSRGYYGYTEDGGKNWSIDSLTHPLHSQLDFRSMAVTRSAVHLLSVGSPALLFRSVDKGQHWNIVYQENDSMAFYDAMAFWDDREGIAMGDPINGCLSIIRTNDGGETWNKLPCDRLPGVEDGEFAFAASNTNIDIYGDNTWIVTGGRKSRVFFSGDRGMHWVVYDTPITCGEAMTGIYSCDFFDAQTGIIWGGDWNNPNLNMANKAFTYDGGKTWELVSDGKGPGYRSCVQYLDTISPKRIITSGFPGISISEDAGVTWKLISSEGFYTVRNYGGVTWMGGDGKIGRISWH